jgi:CubicO group peptidase (beta-lactamase class C family)
MSTRIFMLLLIVPLLAACGREKSHQLTPYPKPVYQTGAETGNSTSIWPVPDWQTTSPEALGIDSGQLAAAIQDSLNSGLQLDSLLVIRNGTLIGEVYFPGSSMQQRHRIFSITKSVISLLIGSAVAQGHLPGIDQTIWTYFSPSDVQNWDERKAAITIEHLLTMTAGLAWDESQISRMAGSRDWAGYMLDLPMADIPGQKFTYCSGCTHLLSVILEKVTGLAAHEYARQVLFEPMGIASYFWAVDPLGHSVGGWGLEMRSRDLARLGLLGLHQGNWQNQQLVPSEWMQTASEPHIVETNSPQHAYGYLWWTAIPGSASDYWYSARGLNAQRIIIVPDRQLIVVTTANREDSEGKIDRMVLEGIVPAIQSDTPLTETPQALEAWQSFQAKLTNAD